MTGNAILPPDVKSGGRRQSNDPRHRARRGGWPAIPPSKSFTLWVPNDHAEKLREIASRKGCSVAALIRYAISETLKNGGRIASVPNGAKARPMRALRKAGSPPLSAE